jgi:hypothetical protein
MSKGQTKQSTPLLWERILALLEEDLVERCNNKVFVELRGEGGTCRKEIGELSAAEIRSLEPGLRERVVEWLLDRYLAEQGRVDLLNRRRFYTKNVRDLTSADLPALIRADQERAEEHREELEREEFVRDVREGLDRLLIAEFAEIGR